MSSPAPAAGPSNPSPPKDAPPAPASASGSSAAELSNRKKKRDAWQNRKVAKLLATGDLPSAPSPAPLPTPSPSAAAAAASDSPAPAADEADAPAGEAGGAGKAGKVLSKQALKRNKRRQDKKVRIATGAGDEAALLAEKEKLRLKHVAFKAKKTEAKKAEKAEKAKEKAEKNKVKGEWLTLVLCWGWVCWQG